jgi:hypothetical protein
MKKEKKQRILQRIDSTVRESDQKVAAVKSAPKP